MKEEEITAAHFQAKKKGAKGFLTPHLCSTLYNVLRGLRQARSVVNSVIVKTTVLEIAKFNNSAILKENGGKIEFKRGWVQKWLSQQGWMRRKSTTGHR